VIRTPAVLSWRAAPLDPTPAAGALDSTLLSQVATATPLALFGRFSSSPKGLTDAEADERLAVHGENTIRGGAGPTSLRWARSAMVSPFVGLLGCLGVVFAVLGDLRGAVTVAAMVSLSVAVRWWQQARTDRAVDQLRGLVTTTATVRRRVTESGRPFDREMPPSDLVPGDVVRLAPGDLVPADVRVLSAANLLVDQSVLSGESLPVRKSPPSLRTAMTVGRAAGGAVAELSSVCFAGTSVVGGSATALVVATGAGTRFGAMAQRPAGRPAAVTSFDRGVRAVGWMLVRFMFVMVPIVLAVNGTVTGDWAQALLFAVAVAVGLTPEMLPVIVTTNLARGAVLLSRRQVIVKRLGAIQDLGAMDILCVDKTGTLTEDRVAYAQGIDITGRVDEQVVEYAGIATVFQEVAYNRLDEAILDRQGQDARMLAEAAYRKVDELPFDHDRRRATIVVSRLAGEHILITKGDPDDILTLCTYARRDRDLVELTNQARDEVTAVVVGFQARSMRILAVATRQIRGRLGGYTTADERDMVLLGFLGFVDPTAPGAPTAIGDLTAQGVAVKVLTGDSPLAAARVCRQVGMAVGEIVLGDHIDAADDRTLRALVEDATVFARLTPPHKTRVVAALHQAGHTVGFLGDGVNDSAVLRTADVGISVDTGTDAAKDAADIILLRRDLTVLAQGVTEGRRTLGNTLKYVYATASSNFGNVLSLLFASAFLPFLPMLPMQLVVQNLLYDTAQLALPWDRVDARYLSRPRRWDARGLARFMLVFGPVSSLFDLVTFAVLAWVLGAGSVASQASFQAGWFIESLASQVLVVLVLRTRSVGLRVSRPSGPVVAAAGLVLLAGVLIPLSPLAPLLRMGPLPDLFFPWLVAILLGYAVTAHLAKAAYLHRFRTWM
jgi:Mg2+-importing ATPase